MPKATTKKPVNSKKPVAEKNKGGRPPVWSEEKVREIAPEIFLRLSLGESAIKIRKDLGINSYQLSEWVGRYEWFSTEYVRARYEGFDKMADDMMAIADQIENDRFPNGKPNNEVVQRARLRIDTRKWILAKLHPAKYGDKVEIDHSGSVQIQKIQRTVIDPLTIDQKLIVATSESLQIDFNKQAEDENDDDSL